jgi:hypothetical protein
LFPDPNFNLACQRHCKLPATGFVLSADGVVLDDHGTPRSLGLKEGATLNIFPVISSDSEGEERGASGGAGVSEVILFRLDIGVCEVANLKALGGNRLCVLVFDPGSAPQSAFCHDCADDCADDCAGC